MNLIVIKYNAGNIRSVIFALNRLGIEPVLTDDPDLIRAADKVIFPGVGEASTTMRYLRNSGLDGVIPSLTQPVLGICLGMQLMCRHSEEGNVDCMGIFDHQVKRFPAGSLKVPHIGWNRLDSLNSPLMEKLGENPFVYFVHSYFVEKGDYTIATTDYGLPFSAALQKDNFFATQFHPEKSGSPGSQILKNFITYEDHTRH
ncbi:MAG: imidazole glycerol phosphate synthase subunit HisH [Bacteroidia bacterium]|nr:imidazole glycerol phosphate synthase subunit HisH [Bacteroidia bacterium]